MTIRITYAAEGNPAQMLNPYNVEMVIVGDIDSVAAWIDEHIIAGGAALGGHQYVQGQHLQFIKKALVENDTLDLSYGLLKIERL